MNFPHNCFAGSLTLLFLCVTMSGCVGTSVDLVSKPTPRSELTVRILTEKMQSDMPLGKRKTLTYWPTHVSTRSAFESCSSGCRNTVYMRPGLQTFTVMGSFVPGINFNWFSISHDFLPGTYQIQMKVLHHDYVPGRERFYMKLDVWLEREVREGVFERCGTFVNATP